MTKIIIIIRHKINSTNICMQSEQKILPLQQRMPCLNPVYPAEYDQLFVQIKQRIIKQDYSAQTNALIEKLLVFGETNYTCWVAKKRIYWAGNTSIEHEDEYSANMLLDDNFKNFQLWDFRNFIVQVTKDYEKQYNLMDTILEQSPKNYHLWSNRTKLVGIVGNFQQEIKRTSKFITSDCFNNSAWTYRAFCFHKLSQKDYKNEIEYVLEMIKKHVDNEAAWNYLRGMFPCYKLRNVAAASSASPLQQYSDYPMIKQLCNEIIQASTRPQKMKIQALLTILIIDSHNEETVKYAKQVCAYLCELQPMRVNFYKWLQNAL